uniref:NADAR domain-containing protein n=1 Tax=Parastrongyloides trichosuri TaxID=131310 RepID=A0A0N4ZA91_PARTI
MIPITVFVNSNNTRLRLVLNVDVRVYDSSTNEQLDVDVSIQEAVPVAHEQDVTPEHAGAVHVTPEPKITTENDGSAHDTPEAEIITENDGSAHDTPEADVTTGHEISEHDTPATVIKTEVQKTPESPEQKYTYFAERQLIEMPGSQRFGDFIPREKLIAQRAEEVDFDFTVPGHAERNRPKDKENEPLGTSDYAAQGPTYYIHENALAMRSTDRRSGKYVPISKTRSKSFKEFLDDLKSQQNEVSASDGSSGETLSEHDIFGGSYTIIDPRNKPHYKKPESNLFSTMFSGQLDKHQYLLSEQNIHFIGDDKNPYSMKYDKAVFMFNGRYFRSTEEAFLYYIVAEKHGREFAKTEHNLERLTLPAMDEQICTWIKSTGLIMLKNIIKQKFSSKSGLLDIMKRENHLAILNCTDTHPLFACGGRIQDVKRWIAEQPLTAYEIPAMKDLDIEKLYKIFRGQNLLGVLTMIARAELSNERKF